MHNIFCEVRDTELHAKLEERSKRKWWLIVNDTSVEDLSQQAMMLGIKKPRNDLPRMFDTRFDAANFGGQLQNRIKTLYGSELLSDLQLLIGDEVLRVHKFVLFAWSERFQEILSKDPSIKELRVDLKSEEVAYFKLLLEFIYTGALSQKVTQHNVMELLEMSHNYGIVPLKEECGDFLFENSRGNLNVVYLLDIAKKFKAHRLEAKCAGYLAENFEDLIRGEMEGGEGLLQQLEISTWVELVKSDDVNVSREEDLFNAVLRYADTKGQTREETLSIITQLLPHIRFTLCSPKFLVEEVEANEDLMSIPIMRNLLFEAFRLRVHPKASALRASINTTRRKANLNVLLQWDKDQFFTRGVYSLENDNLTAHKSSQPGTIYILRTKGKLEPPGNYYWEINLDTLVGAQEVHIGVAEDTFNFNTAYLRAQGAYYIERTGAIMSGHSQVASGPVLSTGDSVGFRLNLDEETFEIFHNGVSVYTFTGIRGTMWPCLAVRDVGCKLTLVGRKPTLYSLGKGK